MQYLYFPFMKKIILALNVLFFLGLTHNAFAQDSEYDYLLKGKRLSFSIFGGPMFELSSVNNNLGFSSGGGGAIMFNRTVFIGGYGMGLNPLSNQQFVVDNVEHSNLALDFGHGGFWLGYVHDYRKVVHFAGSTKFGWGGISLDGNQLNDTYRNSVLVFTPQIEVEVNVGRWFKINGGLGYRFVSGVDQSVFETGQFNSPQATVGFIFGWFR